MSFWTKEEHDLPTAHLADPSHSRLQLWWSHWQSSSQVLIQRFWPETWCIDCVTFCKIYGGLQQSCWWLQQVMPISTVFIFLLVCKGFPSDQICKNSPWGLVMLLQCCLGSQAQIWKNFTTDRIACWRHGPVLVDMRSTCHWRGFMPVYHDEWSWPLLYHYKLLMTLTMCSWAKDNWYWLSLNHTGSCFIMFC